MLWKYKAYSGSSLHYINFLSFTKGIQCEKYLSYVSRMRPCFDSANYLVLIEDVVCREVKAEVKKKKNRVDSF